MAIQRLLRVLIAGSRSVRQVDIASIVKLSGYPLREVVHGGAPGVDQIAGIWAGQRGLPCRVFKADWKLHGKRAGPVRNRQMADYADALVAIWDGQSPGTADMIATMRSVRKPVFIHLLT